MIIDYFFLDDYDDTDDLPLHPTLPPSDDDLPEDLEVIARRLKVKHSQLKKNPEQFSGSADWRLDENIVEVKTKVTVLSPFCLLCLLTSHSRGESVYLCRKSSTMMLNTLGMDVVSSQLGFRISSQGEAEFG